MDWVTRSETETALLGRQIALEIFSQSDKRRQVFIELRGSLGAGKTSFARGFIQSWLEASGESVPVSIQSPTFTIAQIYGEKQPLAHLDLYRLESFAELEDIGFENYFYGYSCCIVEWLEKITEASLAAPKNRMIFSFFIKENTRIIVRD